MSVMIAENEVLNKELTESIQKALDYVSKEKKYSNSEKKEDNKVHALDSLVDDLLQMKEGERKAQLIRPIVPIREWLNNEYYCGAEVFNLYPFWKEHLIRIYESPVLINEIILTRRFRNW